MFFLALGTNCKCLCLPIWKGFSLFHFVVKDNWMKKLCAILFPLWCSKKYNEFLSLIPGTKLPWNFLNKGVSFVIRKETFLSPSEFMLIKWPRVGRLGCLRMGAGHWKDQVIGRLELLTISTNFWEGDAGWLNNKLYKNSWTSWWAYTLANTLICW